MTSRKHGFAAKTLHWGFVALYAYGIAKGLDNVEQLEDAAFLNFEMTFATVFLAVLVLRFLYMRWAGSTSLPEDTPRWKMRAAKLGHLGIYGSIAMISVTGLVIGALYSAGVTNGLLMDLAIAIHELFILASYALIALHIFAALYHRWLGDGVWSSMVPVFKETRN